MHFFLVVRERKDEHMNAFIFVTNNNIFPIFFKYSFFLIKKSSNNTDFNSPNPNQVNEK